MGRCCKTVSLLAVLLAVGTLVFLSWAGHFVSTPAHEPHRADLIVSLGGDGGNRVMTVARLYREGWAPRIMLTGIEGGDSNSQGAFLEWRARLLMEQGIPREALLFGTAKNSYEEANVVLALMRREGFRKVLVVSDPPHLRRLSWVWGRVFSGKDMEFYLIPSEMPQWNAARWWSDEKTAQFVLVEIIKIAYYAIAGRF